jgi:hypothetical protein
VGEESNFRASGGKKLDQEPSLDSRRSFSPRAERLVQQMSGRVSDLAIFAFLYN